MKLDAGALMRFARFPRFVGPGRRGSGFWDLGLAARIGQAGPGAHVPGGADLAGGAVVACGAHVAGGALVARRAH